MSIINDTEWYLEKLYFMDWTSITKFISFISVQNMENKKNSIYSMNNISFYIPPLVDEIIKDIGFERTDQKNYITYEYRQKYYPHLVEQLTQDSIDIINIVCGWIVPMNNNYNSYHK